MKFDIPAIRLEALKKKLDRIVKKGGELNYTVLRHHFETLNFSNDYFEFVEIEVSGNYKINDWEVAAVIDHTPNGNIVRKINLDLEVPERYKDSAPYCEHCNTLRKRKDTILVHNIETNEFKQVGKSCLLDYTGIDAEEITKWYTILTEEMAYGTDEEYIRGNSCPNYSVDEIIMCSYLEVKNFGYDTTIIKDHVLTKYMARNFKIDEDLLSKIKEWVDNLEITNDYLRNAKLAFELSYVEPRHIKLIASLINIYIREQQAILKNKLANNNFVGEIGERINIKLASARVIFTSYNRYDYYHTTASYTYILTDVNGNVYKWTTDKDLEGNEEIIATVKSHDEYKGQKQTTITRGIIK